jgi:hypothetical protein
MKEFKKKRRRSLAALKHNALLDAPEKQFKNSINLKYFNKR